MEPNTVSDHTHAFLDDPRWPKHIKDPRLKQIKRQFWQLLTILVIEFNLYFCLVSYNSSSSWFNFYFLVNYYCSTKYIGFFLVNYSYFDNCPRPAQLAKFCQILKLKIFDQRCIPYFNIYSSRFITLRKYHSNFMSFKKHVYGWML